MLGLPILDISAEYSLLTSFVESMGFDVSQGC